MTNLTEESSDQGYLADSTMHVAAVRHARSRDDLNRLLAGYRPYLRSLADHSLVGTAGCRVDSSDLVQEALLRGVTQLDEFRGSTDAELAAWLKQILDNLLVEWFRFHTAAKRDHRREVGVEADFVSSEPSPSSVLRQKESFEQLNAAMHRLSADQRRVIALRNQELTFDEIGQEMNRNADAARMLWARAVARLGTLMRPDE